MVHDINEQIEDAADLHQPNIGVNPGDCEFPTANCREPQRNYSPIVISVITSWPAFYKLGRLQYIVHAWI